MKPNNQQLNKIVSSIYKKKPSEILVNISQRSIDWILVINRPKNVLILSHKLQSQIQSAKWK